MDSLIKQNYKYNIDMRGTLVYSKGSLVNTLLDSGINEYSEFVPIVCSCLWRMWLWVRRLRWFFQRVRRGKISYLYTLSHAQLRIDSELQAGYVQQQRDHNEGEETSDKVHSVHLRSLGTEGGGRETHLHQRNQLAAGTLFSIVWWAREDHSLDLRTSRSSRSR